ncbi:hypothetical protein N7481_007575 [Penicillium waksmanii]|uniref:uncharacterized protein n=1 Tax=Penicillium waksmanii TaxID=69791 RepID=UPI0025479DCC|nr:uncharacterized protein N7481_007575 [Penicillium waksmanii]KAJ5980277.1 hypothetical protein N7481_007575 [Penicillium waksmanii]
MAELPDEPEQLLAPDGPGPLIDIPPRVGGWAEVITNLEWDKALIGQALQSDFLIYMSKMPILQEPMWRRRGNQDNTPIRVMIGLSIANIEACRMQISGRVASLPCINCTEGNVAQCFIALIREHSSILTAFFSKPNNYGSTPWKISASWATPARAFPGSPQVLLPAGEDWLVISLSLLPSTGPTPAMIQPKWGFRLDHITSSLVNIEAARMQISGSLADTLPVYKKPSSPDIIYVEGIHYVVAQITSTEGSRKAHGVIDSRLFHRASVVETAYYFSLITTIEGLAKEKARSLCSA